jgi:hypothetical protein
MSTVINNIIDRMKNLREFEIEVEIPEGKSLRGVVPFDTTINKNKGKFKVYAISKEEAEQKVKEFLER